MKVLPIIAVVSIMAINVAIIYIFKSFSKFEKHEIISDEYNSRVLKIFFAQFLNTVYRLNIK